MCRGAKGGCGGAEGGQPGKANPVFPPALALWQDPSASTAAPGPTWGPVGLGAAGGCKRGTGGEQLEEESGCPPTAACFNPSQGAGVGPLLSAGEVAGRVLPFADTGREVQESSSSSWGGRLSTVWR